MVAFLSAFWVLGLPHPIWMRLHEVHRIGRVKSMAGLSHPGELICKYTIDGMRQTRSADAAVLAQEFLAIFRDGHEQPEAGNGLALDLAAIDGIFPDGQSRAGRTPGRDHLGIKPRLPGDPFDKIKHQRVCRLRHRAFSFAQKAKALLRTSKSQLP
jgi:hypothetical protein